MKLEGDNVAAGHLSDPTFGPTSAFFRNSVTTTIRALAQLLIRLGAGQLANDNGLRGGGLVIVREDARTQRTERSLLPGVRARARMVRRKELRSFVKPVRGIAEQVRWR